MSDTHGGGLPPPGAEGPRVSPASTIELLALARRGDRSALNLLFERHHSRLRRWASGRLPAWARDLADTDDLVQDTLLQTFRRLDAFDARGVGALNAYLRQAVLNRVRDELRRYRRRPAIGGLDEEVESDEASPIEQAIGRETVERYERALAALRPDEQAAIIGRIEMGSSYEELAEELGKPSAEAARKASARALVRLAERMGNDTA
jgi:RNA polymerase sigma-70 factor (ECF subfamily)